MIPLSTGSIQTEMTAVFVYIMVEKAVKWFMTLDRSTTETATLKGCAEDFSSSVIIDGEKYDYVWGDEFDGNFFDQTKFVQRSHMSGSPSARILTRENETLKIEDGLMKMSAIPNLIRIFNMPCLNAYAQTTRCGGFTVMPEEENDGYHTYGFKWMPSELILSVPQSFWRSM